MTWNIFSTGSLADADKVMENFYHVFDGHRLPYSGNISSSITAVDDIHKIGSSDYRWNDVYANRFYVYGSITAQCMLTLKAAVTLTATASSIEITGLDGDSVDYYHIMFIYPTIPNATDTAQVRMILNGDSSANYTYSVTPGTTTFVYLNVDSTKYGGCFVDIFLRGSSTSEKHGVIRGVLSTTLTAEMLKENFTYYGLNKTESIKIYGSTSTTLCPGVEVKILAHD